MQMVVKKCLANTLTCSGPCISELSLHAPTFRMKMWLVMLHDAQGPAAIDVLAASGQCCIRQDLAQLCKSCRRVSSADHNPTLSKGCARIAQAGKIIIRFETIQCSLGRGGQGAQQEDEQQQQGLRSCNQGPKACDQNHTDLAEWCNLMHGLMYTYPKWPSQLPGEPQRKYVGEAICPPKDD